MMLSRVHCTFLPRLGNLGASGSASGGGGGFFQDGTVRNVYWACVDVIRLQMRAKRVFYWFWENESSDTRSFGSDEAPEELPFFSISIATKFNLLSLGANFLDSIQRKEKASVPALLRS